MSLWKISKLALVCKNFNLWIFSPMSLCFVLFQFFRTPRNNLIDVNNYALDSHLKVHMQWSHDTYSSPVCFLSLCFPSFSLSMNILGQIWQRTAVALMGWFSMCWFNVEEVEKYLGHLGQRQRSDLCTSSVWIFRFGFVWNFKQHWLQVSLLFQFSRRGEHSAARVLMAIKQI